MCTMEDRTGCRAVEEFTCFALVCSTILEARVEVFFATFQTWHSVWKTDFYEILLAYLFAIECGEEIHEIPFMIPFFHAYILAGSNDIFCVNWVGIFKIKPYRN